MFVFQISINGFRRSFSGTHCGNDRCSTGDSIAAGINTVFGRRTGCFFYDDTAAGVDIQSCGCGFDQRIGRCADRHDDAIDVQDRINLPELRYRVVEVKLPFLYDMCRRQMVKDLTQAAQLQIPYEYRDKLEPVDAAPWGAEEAYYVVNNYNSWESNRFYLCYEDSFVDITFDWTVTEEQKAIVSSVFR